MGEGEWQMQFARRMYHYLKRCPLPMNENGILHLILAKRPEKVRMEMEYWHPPVSRIALFYMLFL
jgi:hypothetical protein